MPKQKVGIFGGSFSPPHIGHVHAAELFLEQCHLDKLYIIPAFRSPGKEGDGGASAEQRLAMCRLAFSHLPNTEISDMEILRGGESYTKDTLSALSAEDTQLIMLLGTDTALAIDSWKEPETLFALADFVCVRREDDAKTAEAISQKNRLYKQKYNKEIRVLDGKALPASSSEVRFSIKEGREIPVPQAVSDYIKEQGLYQ